MKEEVTVGQMRFGHHGPKSRRGGGRSKHYPEDKEPKEKISITIRPLIIKEIEETELGKRSRSLFLEKCYTSSKCVNPVSSKFIVIDEEEERKKK